MPEITITESRVHALRAAALEAKDATLVHICSVALRIEPAITTVEEYQARYGADGHPIWLRAAMLHAMREAYSQTQAWVLCARILNDEGEEA